MGGDAETREEETSWYRCCSISGCWCDGDGAGELCLHALAMALLIKEVISEGIDGAAPPVVGSEGLGGIPKSSSSVKAGDGAGMLGRYSR